MSKSRTVVHQIFQKFGLDIIRHPSRVAPHDGRSYAARRARWLKTGGHTVVLDVGANVGHYALEIRELGYQGRIISFEPQTAAFLELQRLASTDPNWRLVQTALGESESTMEMNISGDSQCSSILPMDVRHLHAYPASAYVGKEKIRVATLDSLQPELLSETDDVWLKMDVQGYEMNVLRGATRTMGQVSVIEMELSVATLYEGSTLLVESLGWMARAGYALIGLEEIFLDEQTLHALALNGIFQRVPVPEPY